MLFALGLGLALAGTAHAHPQDRPKLLRARLSAGSLELHVSLDLEPGAPSRSVRRAFDTDRSGRLDPEERARAERFLVETATLHLRVEVDGRPLALARIEAKPAGLELETEAADGVGILLVLRAPLTAGARRLVVSDRGADPQRPVGLVLELGREHHLVLASQGEWQPALRTLQRVELRPGSPLRLELSPAP